MSTNVGTHLIQSLAGEQLPTRRNPFLKKKDGVLTSRWADKDYALLLEGEPPFKELRHVFAFFLIGLVVVFGVLWLACNIAGTLHPWNALVHSAVAVVALYFLTVLVRKTETSADAHGQDKAAATAWGGELALTAAVIGYAALQLSSVVQWFAVAPLLFVPFLVIDVFRFLAHSGVRERQPREFSVPKASHNFGHGSPAKSSGNAAASGPASTSTRSHAVNASSQPEHPALAEPAIKELLRDLTADARAGKGEAVVGRTDELEEIEVVLGALKPANAVLLGPAGTGKTAIAEGLAQLWVKSQKKRRVLLLDAGAVGAAAGIQGAVERTWRAIIIEAQKPNVVLAVDEAHSVFKDERVANLLKPALANGSIRMLAMSTPKEWRRDVETDAALTRRFTTVHVQPPTEAEAFPIVRFQADRAAKHNHVRIPDAAVETSISLATRYITDEALPGSAIKLITGAASRAQYRKQRELMPDLVAVTLASRLKLPVSQFIGSARERLSALPDILKSAVIGQDPAMDELAAATQAKLMGISDRKRPAGFIFLGPTGVGKTEAAKALAEELAPENPNALLHLHMSEYQERHDLSKLTGTAPGYIGHEEGGKLTNGAKLAQVILFDEIEKAHPDLQKAVLLPLLDEGELTDNSGEKVSFAQKVIILTSNLGANGAATTEAEMLAAAQSFFLPEVWARISHKLVFTALTREDAFAITEKLLASTAKQMQADQHIELFFSEELREALVQHGFDANGGARSLRPIITRSVENALTTALLAEALPKHSSAELVPTQDRSEHGHVELGQLLVFVGQ